MSSLTFRLHYLQECHEIQHFMTLTLLSVEQCRSSLGKKGNADGHEDLSQIHGVPDFGINALEKSSTAY
jgi:hypothetical protein